MRLHLSFPREPLLTTSVRRQAKWAARAMPVSVGERPIATARIAEEKSDKHRQQLRFALCTFCRVARPTGSDHEIRSRADFPLYPKYPYRPAEDLCAAPARSSRTRNAARGTASDGEQHRDSLQRAKAGAQISSPPPTPPG